MSQAGWRTPASITCRLEDYLDKDVTTAFPGPLTPSRRRGLITDDTNTRPLRTGYSQIGDAQQQYCSAVRDEGRHNFRARKGIAQQAIPPNLIY